MDKFETFETTPLKMAVAGKSFSPSPFSHGKAISVFITHDHFVVFLFFNPWALGQREEIVSGVVVWNTNELVLSAVCGCASHHAGGKKVKVFALI